MEGNGRVAIGTLVFVMATFALDAYSSLNSSPQTTEINAHARADTLMKWVKLTDVVVLSGGLVAWVISGRLSAFLAAAGVATAMHFLYEHAKQSGLASDEPATEDVAPAAY